MAPTHSPPPGKELSPDSHLKSKVSQKNYQKHSSCLTKHVYCNAKMHARLVQQNYLHCLPNNCSLTKNQQTRAKLEHLCLTREDLVCHIAIEAVCYWSGTDREAEATQHANGTVCRWPVQELPFVAGDFASALLTAALLYAFVDRGHRYQTQFTAVHACRVHHWELQSTAVTSIKHKDFIASVLTEFGRVG